ncbi:MAG: right-handed parallel beta-helix repeat-containing protein, partial [Methanophagales archaeon]|nr:right-handed parallel beta-helix repeat-containing protein [Methanophagales archaeon]
FTGIQDAITAASAGDTIIVSDGNYTENVRVYKRLTIQSESGPDATIVQAAAYVEICGFTAKGADTGIYLCDADYCNISNNNCSNNGGGISLQDSNSNSISNNTCTSNNGDGIYLGGSNKNIISNNNCTNNGEGGFSFYESNNNSILNNNCDRISLFCLNYNLIYLNNFLKKTDNVFFMNQPTHGTPQKKILTPTTKGHTRTT